MTSLFIATQLGQTINMAHVAVYQVVADDEDMATLVAWTPMGSQLTLYAGSAAECDAYKQRLDDIVANMVRTDGERYVG